MNPTSKSCPIDVWTNLRGVIDYSDPVAVFSDHFSPVALSPAGTDQVGVHRFFLKGQGVNGSTNPVLQPFARLFVASNQGGWEPVGVESRISEIWGWTEEGQTDEYHIRQEVFMPTHNAVKIHWQLDPHRCGLQAPRIAVMGAPLEGQVLFGGQYKSNSLLLTLDKRYENWFLKREGTCLMYVRFSATESPLTAGFLPGEHLAYTGPQEGSIHLEERLALGETGAYWIEVPLQKQNDGDSWIGQLIVSWDFEKEPLPPQSELFLATANEARQRWVRLLSSLPDLPQDTSRYWRRRMAGLVAVLIGSGVRAPGYGAFAEDLCILATATKWASTGWFWDCFFSLCTLGMLSSDWQASAVNCYARHTQGGRMTPGILLSHPVQTSQDETNDCYAPIATWALSKVWNAGGPRPKAAEIYPGLLAIHESWFACCDRDGDGVPEWRNSGNPADDSPLFDRYSPEPGKATCFSLPPFISVSLCSYLHFDALLLAEMADQQGLQQDATRLRTRASNLEKILLECCWDEEDLFFYDLTPEREKTKVKTFFGLLPLWAGVALPSEKAHRAIEAHLLNPDEFWGPIPFPSVAYNEPTYDPTGYWRGRSWPHLYCWNTEILWQFGYEKEADHARDTFLKLNAVWNGPMENFPTNPKHLHAPVLLNYNWGASALYYFLNNWHRMPLMKPVAK